MFRQQRRIGETHIVIVRCNLRHRHRPFGQLRNTIAADVVGGDHRLALADQHAQADVVAFGTFRFFNVAVPDFDALRDAAHRDSISGIRARTFRGFYEPLRQRAQCSLIEKPGCC